MPDEVNQLPARSAARAMNATALIAVLAMAASVSPSVREAAVSLESRLALHESDAVRTVAAVVAAAARDLLSDRTTTSAPALPVAAVCEVRMVSQTVSMVETAARAAPGESIGLRLLDLPPPIA